MVILIGNLPKQAAERDLCQLLGLTPGTNMRIVKKPDRNGKVQRFALVPVDGDRAGRRLIARAHGTEWRGCTLVGHEYQHRTGACERRRIDWRTRSWDGEERRLDERRSFTPDPRSRVA